MRDGRAAVYASIAWCLKEIVGMWKTSFSLKGVTAVSCAISDEGGDICALRSSICTWRGKEMIRVVQTFSHGTRLGKRPELSACQNRPECYYYGGLLEGGGTKGFLALKIKN
jgi:hypothetical protein